MKLIINNKQQRMLAEFIQKGFSLAALDSIPCDNDGSYTSRYNYCRKFLGEPLGQGTSRVVFEIGDDTVLKLVKNTEQDAIAQSKNEFYIIQKLSKKYPNLFPRIYQHASDFSWLECERVLPFSDSDSITLFGMPYSPSVTRYRKTIDSYKRDYKQYMHKRQNFPSIPKGNLTFGISFVDFLDWCERVKYNDTKDEEDEFYFKFIHRHPSLLDIYKYISEEIKGYNDIFDNNLGLAIRDGKPYLVILDAGFDVIDDEKLNESINEYMDKDFISPLKNYVRNNPWEEKLKKYAYLIPIFLLNYQIIKSNEYAKMMNEWDDNQFIDFLREKGLEENFMDYLFTYSEDNEQYLGLPDTSLSFTQPKVFKTNWVCHFTSIENAFDICQNGFKNAIPKEYMKDKLAFSREITNRDFDAVGYAYGFDAKDPFYIENTNERNAIVMCVVHGVKVFHTWDRTKQVIFKSDDARNFVLIKRLGDEYAVMGQKNGKIIEVYRTNKLSAVKWWVIHNYNQYRNILTFKK